MSRLIASVVGLLFGLSAVSLAQNAQATSPRDPEITASGRGEVRLAPDYAYVLIGVNTQSPSAGQTGSQNAVKVAAVIAALHALGLTDQQVVTSGYTLTQTYDYPKNQQPRLTGFSARNTIRAEVRRLEDVGKVIDAAINSGATDISSIQFLASNTDQARRSSLSDAVRQARNDADAMARAAGGALGRLMSISSSGVSQPIAIRTYSLESTVLTAGGSGSMMPPTPINPGELSVTAMVFARWEFVANP